MDDSYLPSNTSATLTVQQSPIPAPVTRAPLPTNYWNIPIYGENSLVLDFVKLVWHRFSSGACNGLWHHFRPQQRSSRFEIIGGCSRITLISSHHVDTANPESGGVVSRNPVGSFGGRLLQGCFIPTKIHQPDNNERTAILYSTSRIHSSQPSGATVCVEPYQNRTAIFGAHSLYQHYHSATSIAFMTPTSMELFKPILVATAERRYDVCATRPNPSRTSMGSRVGGLVAGLGYYFPPSHSSSWLLL